MRPDSVRAPAALLALAFLATCCAPARPTHDGREGVVVVRPASLRPAIVGRAAWHADEKAVHSKPLYDHHVRAIFVHHTDNPNGYDCRRDVPAMLLAMQERHIHVLDWDDLGYNFVVDKCGTIYEGRGGGVDRDVRGAHTEGFNADTVGVAALGSFGAGEPVPRPMLEAIAAIAAWKLDRDVDPAGQVRLVSSNGRSRYPKGTAVKLNAVSGHRDVYETTCPGDALYAALPWIRATAAGLRRQVTLAAVN